MINNMRMAAKMALGFGLVIALVLTVGTIAVLNMSQINAQSIRMRDEHVPEVRISNAMERNVLLSMHNMRGYSMSFDESYYALAENHMAGVGT